MGKSPPSEPIRLHAEISEKEVDELDMNRPLSKQNRPSNALKIGVKIKV